MRRHFLRATLLTATLAASAFAQMHKVAKPEQVVRAVGVYEWTGDFAKPTASRLIPVTVFIDGKLEDAGVYTARPIPFALLPGNVYVLQTAGIDKGTLDLAYARHFQAVEATGDLAYDDGWFGYGTIKPLAAPKKAVALKPSKTLPVITASTNGPHFSSKPAADSTSTTSSGDSSKPAATTTTPTSTTSSSDDPDRPTMKRRDSSGTTTADSTTTPAPADDPDRPTMKRRDSSGTTTADSTSATQTTSPSSDDPDRPTLTRKSPTTSTTDTSSTTTTSGSSTPADDPDRPTLKRRSPEEAKRSSGSAGSSGSGVTAVGDLNADPNRPNLHHGKPTSSMTEADLPRLTGLPSNLHQSVAVSDAINRDPHPFTLDWDDEAQHQAILKKMQTLAQAQLAAYGKPSATAPPATTSTTPKKTTPTTTRATTHEPAVPPPSQPLLEEELKAYTLSYGGAPTYIYTANTGGTGVALRYVTIVAQADGMGELKPAIQSVTDAAHLDRTPRMHFVDVVDAEASNRASLLFELRSQNARQFALYRVIASHPEQIFLTGTTQ